jgi:hypothetical protein
MDPTPGVGRYDGDHTEPYVWSQHLIETASKKESSEDGGCDGKEEAWGSTVYRPVSFARDLGMDSPEPEKYGKGVAS